MAGDLTVAQAIFLGALQGVTEWLPVSSSGHLVLAQEFLRIEAPFFFDLVLHLGTLLVVVVFFRGTILGLLRAWARAPGEARAAGSWRRVAWRDPERRLSLLVVLGSLPAAIVGLTFDDALERLFSSALAVGASLLAMGAFLFLTKYAPEAPTGLRHLKWRDALLIGCAQSLALMPGVSRSGSTIGAALLLGVDRELAVRYSFLLAIPAIAGAALLTATGEALAAARADLAAYAAGVAAAVAVGYATLYALVLIVRKRGFHYFAFYCWGAGAAALAAVRFLPA